MRISIPKLVTSVKIEHAELEDLHRRIEHLFGTIREILEMESTKAFGEFLPSIDLAETSDALTVTMELPGIETHEVRLTINGDQLSIEGVKDRKQPRGVVYSCCEREYGKFSRQIQLRWSINIDEATAELIDGILTLKLPKLRERRGKILEIPIVGKDANTSE